jgi:beta-glucosidase
LFMMKFPREFLWGAATSSYQVEGNNSNADWWHWEIRAGKENSGEACRHYEFYEQDFDLAKSLNHNAHRFSVEWSRIEPVEGTFSREELQHYINVILALKARGIEPIVTLHHFTNPDWFAGSGGWLDRRSTPRFLRYCEFVVRGLAPHVRYWITINEPAIYYSHAYIFGAWPPQKKSVFKGWRVENNLVRAHLAAYPLINKIYREAGLDKPAVSISQNVMAFVPCTSELKNRLAAFLRDKWYNRGFLDRVRGSLDFIGINYYSRQLVDLKGWGPGNFAWDACEKEHHPVKKNSLGWDIYPEGLAQALLKLKNYGLPVMITENGICTEDDGLRWEYIREHLKNIHLAMEKGVKVTGYLYWSLLDNFEWDKGFAPRFGLIGVDYNNYQRTVRGSARKFAQVCRDGVLEEKE